MGCTSSTAVTVSAGPTTAAVSPAATSAAKSSALNPPSTASSQPTAKMTEPKEAMPSKSQTAEPSGQPGAQQESTQTAAEDTEAQPDLGATYTISSLKKDSETRDESPPAAAAQLVLEQQAQAVPASVEASESHRQLAAGQASDPQAAHGSQGEVVNSPTEASGRASGTQPEGHLKARPKSSRAKTAERRARAVQRAREANAAQDRRDHLERAGLVRFREAVHRLRGNKQLMQRLKRESQIEIAGLDSAAGADGVGEANDGVVFSLDEPDLAPEEPVPTVDEYIERMRAAGPL